MNEMSRREALRGGVGLAATVGLPHLASGAAEPGETASSKLKIVIAGAHPDDPESGCGGAIALYSDAGHEVVSIYLTRGEAGIPGKTHEEASKIRTAEAEEACRILGARPLFLGQIDGSTEVNAKSYDEVNKVIEEEKPDIVITHWPVDTHRDHRVISLLVYDTWLRAKKQFELFYFEVLSGDQTQHFHPTHYVDITSVQKRKRESCFAHKSQGPEHFYERHELMHKFRGREAGVQYAEAYIRHCQGKLGVV